MCVYRQLGTVVNIQQLFVMNTSGTFSFSVFYGILINFIRYNDRVTAIKYKF